MYVQFCSEAKNRAYWLVNETLWYETEMRPRRLETTSRDLLETETSRPRLHPWYHLPACITGSSVLHCISLCRSRLLSIALCHPTTFFGLPFIFYHASSSIITNTWSHRLPL